MIIAAWLTGFALVWGAALTCSALDLRPVRFAITCLGYILVAALVIFAGLSIGPVWCCFLALLWIAVREG
jgi:hypothetical protein